MNDCKGLWDTEASQPTWSDLHYAAFSKSDGLQRALGSCALQMFRAAVRHISQTYYSSLVLLRGISMNVRTYMVL